MSQSDRPFSNGCAIMLLYFIMSKKKLSINVLLLLATLVGKFTTLVKLKVFIYVTSFCLAEFSVIKFILKSAHGRNVREGRYRLNCYKSLPIIKKTGTNSWMQICIRNV